MAENKKELTVSKDFAGERIDKIISKIDDSLSRSRIQKLVSEGKLLVNGSVVTSNSYKCAEGDRLTLYIPAVSEINISAENIPLKIIYEDEDIIIIDKPKGMVVHPAPGHYSDTLVNALMYHCKDSLSGINGELRPGIVHRIDMNTTGLLVICKNDKAHVTLAEKLSTHDITRKYYCIVNGHFKENEGTVDKEIGRHPVDRKKMAVNVKNGRRAVTHYRVIYSFDAPYSLIECTLETGRTHQIRVHMASIGHSLLGDDIYGSKKQPYKTEGQVLHAAVLGFIHPTSGNYIEFSSHLPEYFIEIIRKICSSKEEYDHVLRLITEKNII
ncbi:MAG: RluA family pseudouridine synthase [Lachnospiraceae bacterium]|nr:RluA family pseudouridine synthase [Lachnospiraceae bacterium]